MHFYMLTKPWLFQLDELEFSVESSKSTIEATDSSAPPHRNDYKTNKIAPIVGMPLAKLCKLPETITFQCDH